ncbi:tripartite tricarboxylate transporter substrate binding protein [Pseudorhodoferax sp.]|uniref:tripartite tricarboxylate transporter substrate binding protein n=1 Tax=Pseudorhodoferax sp. TaxID=1993553 RepID=UPI002DD6B7B7|nr:tripartite tricarboxylate transporter substrate binding protein [Pseudorhodoferax sp.]
MNRTLPVLSRRRLVAAAAACAALCAGHAHASDEWPTRPVRIVIAVGPGSSGDTLARMLAPRLEQLWKQPVIVENKPGAGGVVGTEYAIHANDGHTLLLASQSSYLPKYTQKNLRYDPLTDLVPIYRMINWQMVIVTNAETARQARTFPEILKLAASKDQGLFFSGTGITSIFNIQMALVNQPFGMKYTTVDFNNVGAMNMAVLRNDAQLLINAPSSVRAHFETGALVPLAAVSRERYADLPNVPAVAELPGFKGYLPIVWHGMVAPKGMPRAAIERIARDLNLVLQNPELKRTIETQLSGVVQQSSPQAFAKDLEEEARVFGELLAKVEKRD